MDYTGAIILLVIGLFLIVFTMVLCYIIVFKRTYSSYIWRDNEYKGKQ